MDDKEFNKKYESLKKSKFKQQKLLGWRPIPTISCITIIFISFAVFFILFGIIILVFTSQVKEIITNYDKTCNETYLNCPIRITVPEKMIKPIMIYYQIDGFSQNHRVYMDSKSDKQLNGEVVTKEDLKESGVCDYALTNKDMEKGRNDDDLAYPCGLMAKSFFNDVWKEWKIDGEDVNIKKEDIAYKTDKEKYGNINLDSKYWANVTEERFMIWMRPNPFPNPRKLWGIIEERDIEKDSKITLRIDRHYPYQKYIILSTRNVFGGKSSFLGAFYLIFGIICLVTAIVFINLHHIYHKKD